MEKQGLDPDTLTRLRLLNRRWSGLMLGMFVNFPVLIFAWPKVDHPFFFGIFVAAFFVLMLFSVWMARRYSKRLHEIEARMEAMRPKLSTPLTDEEIVAVEEMRSRKGDARGGLSLLTSEGGQLSINNSCGALSEVEATRKSDSHVEKRRRGGAKFC